MINAGGAEEQWQGIGNKDEARKVIKKGLFQLRTCYQHELQNNADAQGKIVVHIEIDEKGQVRNAKSVRNTFSNTIRRSIEDCVLESIRKWIFETSIGGKNASIVYPFEFFKRN
jgi:hypothetical protein